MPRGRDPDEVVAGLVAWLDEVWAPTRHQVTGFERPATGYSAETLLVDVTHDGRDERLALKVAPPGPAIFEVYDFAAQTRVQQAVAAGGIPAAVPARAEADPRWLGAPFMVMAAVAGEIYGEAPALDRRLGRGDPDRNRRVENRYLDVLADIHRVDWRTSGLADVVPRRDNAAEVAHWARYLEWSRGPEPEVPVLADALAWCERNLPVDEPEPSLLWGDVRLGNVVFDGEGEIVAVLDWEMATIGAAEHDLGWHLALQGVQAELVGRTVPGFLGHDASVARYEARSGRAVADLDWYEVLALVRSTAIMTRIARLSAANGEPVMLPIDDNPILDHLARRVDGAPKR